MGGRRFSTWLEQRASRGRLERQGTRVALGVDRTGREVVRVKRPDAYFDADNAQWPNEVELELTLPRALVEAYGKGDALERLRAELACQEEEAREEVREQGWVVLGAARVLSMSPFRRAKSFEPLRSREPHLAAGRGQTWLRVAAIKALQTFREAYRDAREAWARGVRKVVFPKGTWAMARYHAALVAPAWRRGALGRAPSLGPAALGGRSGEGASARCPRRAVAALCHGARRN